MVVEELVGTEDGELGRERDHAGTEVDGTDPQGTDSRLRGPLRKCWLMKIFSCYTEYKDIAFDSPVVSLP